MALPPYGEPICEDPELRKRLDDLDEQIATLLQQREEVSRRYWLDIHMKQEAKAREWAARRRSERMVVPDEQAKS